MREIDLSMATDDERVMNLNIKVYPSTRPGLMRLRYAYGTDTGGSGGEIEVAMGPYDDVSAVRHVLRHMRPFRPKLKYMRASGPYQPTTDRP